MEELNVFAITAALADQVRLSVMLYLIRGAASVTEIINHLEVSQSNLSNHLSVLKNAGLIKSTPSGRQKIYELASPEVAQLIELLLNIQNAPPEKRQNVIKPIQQARTCYDHLAGKLGVALFNTLIEQKAIQFPAGVAMQERQFFSAALELGPDAVAVFAGLDIDLSTLKNSRRKFAFGCLDWTERTPHLGGALGAAICQAFLDKKWIARKTGSRAITITTSGRRGFKNLLYIDTDQFQYEK
jgi:DNA-binding transcriptional ArsR family regulator